MEQSPTYEPQPQAGGPWYPQSANPPAPTVPPPGGTRIRELATKPDPHWIAYSTLMFSLGFEALSAGTFLHLLIESVTQDVPLGGGGAALSLTVALFALPFLVLSARFVRRIEKEEPEARESSFRVVLGYMLLAACATIGSVRLFWAIWNLVNHGLLSPDAVTGAVLFGYLAQIVVAVAIAGGLGWSLWGWLRGDATGEKSSPCTRDGAGAAAAA